MLSPWTNFGKGVITVAPDPATSGLSFSMSTADAAEFPDPDVDGAFDVVVFPATGQPSSANAEIVRVTASAAPSGGNVVFTIVRAQQGSTAREIVITDRVYLGVTKGVLDTLSVALAIGADLANPLQGMLDEDNMASNSAVKGATQQSIKAYADTKSDASKTETLTNKRLTSPKLNEDVVLTATATELNNILSAWTSYTPSTANLTIGNGTLTGRYKKIGKTVFAQIKFVLGSTSAIAQDARINLPTTENTAIESLGISRYVDSSTAIHYPGWWRSGYLGFETTYGDLAPTIPFTWATGDIIWANIVYEEA